jgi:secreted Zn-dependent insulinase-like peptidase
VLTVPGGLTPAGLKRRDDIIALVFNYLDLVRTQGKRPTTHNNNITYQLTLKY